MENGQSHTRGSVLMAFVLLLFFTALGASYAPMTTVFVDRECRIAGIPASLCPPPRSSNDNAVAAAFALAEQRGADKNALTMLVSGLVSLVSCPTIGVLSDARGRKPAIALCLLGQIVGFLAFALIDDFYLLVAVYGIGGLGGGYYAIVGVCFAVCADLTEGLSTDTRTRTFSTVEATLWLGLLAGPVLGGALMDKAGTQTSFIAFAAAPVIALLALGLCFSETLKRRSTMTWSRCNPIGGMAILMKDRVAFRMALSAAFAMCGSSAGITVMMLYCSDVFGWSTGQVGLLSSLMYGSSAIGLAVALPLLLRAMHPRRIIALSMFWAAVTWAAAGLVGSGDALLGVMCCFALNGVYFPVLRSMIASTFGPELFGVSLGAVATMQAVTNAIAPPGFSAVYAATVGMNYTIPGFSHEELGPRIAFSFSPSLMSLVAACIALSLPVVRPAAAGGGSIQAGDGDGPDGLGETGVLGETAGEAKAMREPLLPGGLQN